MNKSHAKRRGPHSGTLVVFDSNPWSDIIIKSNQFHFSLHTGAIRYISPLGEMNVSLSLSINRLSDNSAIDVIQEVNHVITEDSETISEANNSSITLTALSRKTHLRVVSLLRPNLISGGSPRRSQWRLREDMSLEIKTDKENKTQLNKKQPKKTNHNDLLLTCWPYPTAPTYHNHKPIFAKFKRKRTLPLVSQARMAPECKLNLKERNGIDSCHWCQSSKTNCKLLTPSARRVAHQAPLLCPSPHPLLITPSCHQQPPLMAAPAQSAHLRERHQRPEAGPAAHPPPPPLETQLNTNNLKTPTTMTYCWPVDLTLPHQPTTTTTNPYLQSSREKDLTVSVSS